MLLQLALCSLSCHFSWPLHRNSSAHAPSPVQAELGELQLAWVATPDGPRWYRTYLPTTYTSMQPAPVIIFYHGGLGNALQAASSYGIVEEAEARGWIAVFPEGTSILGQGPPFKLETWNAGDCCGPASKNAVDDVAFFTAMRTKLLHTYAIDPSAVFATGMSNGGMMSYRLAAERPDLLTGIAPVAASFEGPLPPSAPVALLSVHGWLDDKVPFVGGVGSGLTDTEFTGQIESFELFLKANGNAALRGPWVAGKALFAIAPGPAAGADTAYFLALDGGHSWPGALPPIANPSEPQHMQFSATTLIFDFFESQF